MSKFSKSIDQSFKLAQALHCWQGDNVVGFENSGEGIRGVIAVTGNYPGKGGVAYARRTARCLETEGFPGTPTNRRSRPPVLSPGETCKHTVIHKIPAE